MVPYRCNGLCDVCIHIYAFKVYVYIVLSPFYSVGMLSPFRILISFSQCGVSASPQIEMMCFDRLPTTFHHLMPVSCILEIQFLWWRREQSGTEHHKTKAKRFGSGRGLGTGLGKGKEQQKVICKA